MVRKLYVTVLLLFVGASFALAQQGILKGTVKDKGNGEPLPFAPVVVYSGTSQIAVAQTDFNGEFTIKPIAAGKYTVKTSSVGYSPIEMTNVIISTDKTTYLDLQMPVAGKVLDEVVVVEYSKPLIDPDVKSGGTVSREEFNQMATKNVLSVAATTAGIYQQDEGKEISVRGTRSGASGEKSATDIYVDGVKVRGGTAVPQSAVDQVSVITGGVPAQFGDVTGGVVSITTRGPSGFHSGGVELITSQYLDKFNYNFIGLNSSGPILFKNDTANGIKRPLLGYFIAADFQTEKDPNPSAIGAWKVNDDTLRYLERNPLLPNGLGGTIRSTEKVSRDALEHIDARQNVRQSTIRLNGKIDIAPTANLNITFGGNYEYSKYHDYTYEYALFNPVNNSQSIDQTYRVWGRVTQKFLNAPESQDEKSASTIKNAFYSLQASYDKVYNVTQDDNHKDKLFNYGYVGKFKTYKAPAYVTRPDSIDPARNIVELLGYGDTLVTFTPDTMLNPTAAAYTTQYYNIYAGDNDQFRTLSDIQAGNALRNGDRPSNVYALWYNTGRQYNGYQIDDRSQYRLMTSFSADIKNHAVIVGFEYEQRDDRLFSISPITLWTLSRQLANKHILDLDLSKNDSVFTNGVFMDTILHPVLVSEASQSFFDKSLRAKVGAKADEWIDIDNLNPDVYSLDMYSADELLDWGNTYGGISYYGYDHTGKKLSTRPTFDDFFTKKDANGNYARPVDAFRPIYMAGYITDNFDFKDLKFRVGVRVDRYDANQKVLKDPYSLYDTRKAGELEIADRPSNIGDDFVVYVSDKENPSPEKVVGYRDGDTWYNKDGVLITNPTVLHSATGIAPYLVNPKDNIQDSTFVPSSSFTDYVPQVNVMPRIAFSFPISDMAMFNANYDVLTMRPSTSNRMNPIQYFYMAQNGGAFINNPNLKPEKTVNYEIGFQQVLDEKQSSKLGLSAFYKEMRDMVQVMRVSDAYPITYNTFGNRDFGTVKGFTVSYDLRRVGNVRMTANYTLQFADATGSGAADAQTLVQSGTPNLRIVHRTDFDQRHRFVVNFDYRYRNGADYNGPVWFNKKVFSDAGANFTLNAGSGTPYSRQLNVTQGDDRHNTAIGRVQTSRLKGDVNGAELPWQYRIDMKLDKSFDVKLGEGSDGEAKMGNVNIYLLVLNVLNTRNVLDVYRFTGSPDDDGYLTAAEYQNEINSAIDPASYTDLYRIKVNNPSHYSLPRRIRLGMSLNF